MSNLKEVLDFAEIYVKDPQGEINTEIQHPSDLMSSLPYFELTLFLIQLDVVPADVHLITSIFWEGYNY